MTEQKRNKGEITAAEAGRRGGQSTLQRKGIGFFKKIGKKGGKRTKELYGELLSEFGKKGGRPKLPTLRESVGGAGPAMKGGQRRSAHWFFSPSKL